MLSSPEDENRPGYRNIVLNKKLYVGLSPKRITTLGSMFVVCVGDKVLFRGVIAFGCEKRTKRINGLCDTMQCLTCARTY